MKKTVLERFISKYNLGGAVDALIWKADKKGLSTKFISDDKNMIGEVHTSELQLDNGEYAIFETTVLKALLSVLDEDLTVIVQKKSGKDTALEFSGNGTKAAFVLANASNIPGVPALKQLPPFEISIDLDKTFSEKFVKAKGALPDVDTFTILSDGKSADVIIGHSDNNTNRVTIKVTPIQTEKCDPINFHAKYLKEIIMANREAKSGKMEIAKQGLARITFDMDDFKVTYYLPEIAVD